MLRGGIRSYRFDGWLPVAYGYSMETEALENSLSAINIVLNFSIGAVVLGLILEYLPEIWNVLHDRKWIERVGAILVITGVAGELLLHIRSEQIDNKIKATQKTTLAELHARAAKAELALAKINSPRQLSDEDARILKARLAPYAGSKFWIYTQTIDKDAGAEQMVFAAQLAGIFSSAGWIKSNRAEATSAKEEPEFGPISDRGCHFAYATDEKSKALGKTVQHSLSAAEIECTANEFAGLFSEFIIVEIGLR
jgi:hypothetical protein